MIHLFWKYGLHYLGLNQHGISIYALQTSCGSVVFLLFEAGQKVQWDGRVDGLE